MTPNFVTETEVLDARSRLDVAWESSPSAYKHEWSDADCAAFDERNSAFHDFMKILQRPYFGTPCLDRNLRPLKAAA